MIGWGEFIYFALTAMALWLLGAFLSLSDGIRSTPVKRRLAAMFSAAGVIVFLIFITCYWLSLGHTPMQSMAETRMWYSFFLSLFGVILYLKYPYPFILPFTSALATVFTIINLAKPELRSAGLPPALQSGWFLPHVAIYMVAYALTALALIFGVVALFDTKRASKHIGVADTLTGLASLFLLAGMLCGAVWAKEAWGDWWAWDAKENWAAATWFLSLIYLHLQVFCKGKRFLRVFVLLITFIALQVTWYGVDKLPAAQDSMHNYSMNK